MESKRVAVTGLGLVSPLGCDVAKFWERIKTGQSGRKNSVQPHV